MSTYVMYVTYLSCAHGDGAINKVMVLQTFLWVLIAMLYVPPLCNTL